MKTYKVTIEEIIAQDFKVEASSEQEAMQKVTEGYKNGDYILENATLIQADVNYPVLLEETE